MAQGVTRVTLEVNGAQFDNFSAFTEDARVISRQTLLMNSTQQSQMLQRHTFSLDRVRIIGDTFEFDNIVNATVTVEYEGGDRTTFTGVHTMEIGSETADGENDMVSTIAFGASGRIAN